MSWKFSQSTGKLERNGYTAHVYAGRGDGKNNPAMDHIANIGPLPRGWYTIGEPYDDPDHGPYSMRLTPDVTNEMHGRAGFLIHADSIKHPGEASEGCIVAARHDREVVGTSGDDRLEVVE